MSLAVICAVNTPLFTKTVGLGLPFHWTCHAGTKPIPTNVRVNPGLPALTADGAKKVITGRGFSPAERILNGRSVETPPPGAGVSTDTGAVPAAAISLAKTVAVNWPELTGPSQLGPILN